MPDFEAASYIIRTNYIPRNCNGREGKTNVPNLRSNSGLLLENDYGGEIFRRYLPFIPMGSPHELRCLQLRYLTQVIPLRGTVC